MDPSGRIAGSWKKRWPTLSPKVNIDHSAGFEGTSEERTWPSRSEKFTFGPRSHRVCVCVFVCSWGFVCDQTMAHHDTFLKNFPWCCRRPQKEPGTIDARGAVEGWRLEEAHGLVQHGTPSGSNHLLTRWLGWVPGGSNHWSPRDEPSLSILSLHDQDLPG